MINKNQVSLRQARTDCNISTTGGLRNVTEFIDRQGSGYTLRSLGGHVLCRSSKQTTGTYRNNYNPASGCRPNYAEGNVYSVNSDHTFVLSNDGGAHYATGNNWAEYDALGGYSYVGTIPSGTASYRGSYSFRMPSTAVRGAVELIGWPDGYFVGTPHYYLSWNTTHDQYGGTLNYSMNGTTHPYVTLCIQALAGRSTSNIRITHAQLYKA